MDVARAICGLWRYGRKTMTLDEYQAAIERFDTSTTTCPLVSDASYVDKILGLAGESGEVADKYKKIIRDKASRVEADDRDALVKELGDVLWYVATLARYLGVSFDEVAVKNIAKLTDRQRRDLIHGEGDDR
jgi:NTP pyrophosphatase (non-canonical NTP hydrolase)